MTEKHLLEPLSDYFPELIEIHSIMGTNAPRIRGVEPVLSPEIIAGKVHIALEKKIQSINTSPNKHKNRVVPNVDALSILSGLPAVLDLTTLDYAMEQSLQTVINDGHGLELLKHLPQKMDLTIPNENSLRLLASFAKQGFGQEVVDWLLNTPDITSSMKKDRVIWFLYALIMNGQAEAVFQRLPNHLNVTMLSTSTMYLFEALAEKGYGQELLRYLPAILEFNTMSIGMGIFLSSLIKNGYGQEIIRYLPPTFDLTAFDESEGNVMVLEAFADHGYGELLFRYFPDDLHLATVSSGGLGFLGALARNGYVTQKFEKLLDTTKDSLRQPLNVNNISLTTKVGPYLFDLIKNFPISPGSMKKMHHGWYRAELEKDGTTTYVFMNMTGQMPKIVFRNDDIQRDSLKTYQQASSFLPGYVSSPAYPELQGNSKKEAVQPRLRGAGFREVYAGPDLEIIEYPEFPSILKESIVAQKNYILLKLAFHKIRHGHPHDKNFNVRFLFTAGNGKKMVSFDVNYAIQVAKAENFTITPIVTLRDWDQGSTGEAVGAIYS